VRPFSPSLSGRSGFTIVELVVVVGIVAVGLALALPGVQHARDEERLAKCKDNLRRIGLALRNYHDTHDRFPYASSFSVVGPQNPGTGHTWNEFLFPYMGLSAVYLKLDFRAPNNTGENAKLLGNLKLPWQRCPSNEFSKKMRRKDGSPFYGWQTDSQGQFYAPCTGTQGGSGMTGYDCAALGLGVGSYCYTKGSEWESPAPAANPGMFGGRNSFSATFDDVTDGAASTLMVGERRAELLGYSGAFSVNFPGAPTLMKLNSKLLNPADSGDYGHNWGFSSQHEGGAHFVFVDGHVSFINDAINYETFCRLSDKADGNKIGDF
jgi:prepilin-type N-terminal cleavage/methylation domain-containing protein/prepilin-type processing-associated H-X9-DG protein